MSDEQYDVRVLRHHLSTGDITRQSYKAFLDGLPDDTEHGEETETKFNNPYEQRQLQSDAEQQ